jgi:hypothetical protein
MTAREPSHPTTVRETLARMDEAWQQFEAAVKSVPLDRMGDRLGEDGWTRKQMLAHVDAWHELAFKRLNDFALTGARQELRDEVDAVNARVARAAEGRTAGEIATNTEASYRRLRRLVENLADKQLLAHSGWPAELIAGDTYEHYAEHLADLQLPEEEQPSAVSSG